MRPFWFINQEQKFSQTCCFCKIMVQSNIKKKTFPDKSNDKPFEEIKKFHWATVPIVQEIKNDAKKTGCHFYSLKIP